MAIYTKRGDKGETSLYDSQSSQRLRVSKDSLRIKAIGSVDELNSLLGVARAFVEAPITVKILKEIQADLLTVGSILAGSNLKFSINKTKRLEKIIDKLESTLPVLANFILPGGSISASLVQLARSVARRSERTLVRLNKKENVPGEIMVYINRLSDTLFMIARQINLQNNTKEDIWKSGKLSK